MKDIVSLPLDSPGPGLDSKYRLGVLAAQRALQIIKGSKPKVETNYRKATSIALAELREGVIPFVLGEEATKARMKDEEMYKQVLSEARASFMDEEGNPLFGPPPADRADLPPS